MVNFCARSASNQALQNKLRRYPTVGIPSAMSAFTTTCYTASEQARKYPALLPHASSASLRVCIATRSSLIALKTDTRRSSSSDKNMAIVKTSCAKQKNARELSTYPNPTLNAGNAIRHTAKIVTSRPTMAVVRTTIN
jgi:hypothetical protein